MKYACVIYLQEDGAPETTAQVQYNKWMMGSTCPVLLRTRHFCSRPDNKHPTGARTVHVCAKLQRLPGGFHENFTPSESVRTWLASILRGAADVAVLHVDPTVPANSPSRSIHCVCVCVWRACPPTNHETHAHNLRDAFAMLCCRSLKQKVLHAHKEIARNVPEEQLFALQQRLLELLPLPPGRYLLCRPLTGESLVVLQSVQ